jgi:tetratricopeptide (TPR) repeat protein
MTQDEPVTERDIESAEKLWLDGEFAAALDLSRRLLLSACDDDARMRLLFNVISCSASLDRSDLIDAAMAELEKLPKPEYSRVLANLNRAWAETSLGRPQNALNILDTDLATGLFEADDMRIHKYRLCLCKGEALVHLRRATDALEWLDKAHALYPTEGAARDGTERLIFGWVEPNIQVHRANCLLALDRLDEAFDAASQVLRKNDSDLATLAMQYVAECRVWQGREEEALRIYADLKKRLPCRLVDEDRIEKGIANCVSRLEKRRPSTKPS